MITCSLIGFEVDEKTIENIVKNPKEIVFEILKKIWQTNPVKAWGICNLAKSLNKFDIKQESIQRMDLWCSNYPNPDRGGMIGELLQLSRPDLRKMKFPFFSYVLLQHPDKPWDFEDIVYEFKNSRLVIECVSILHTKPWDFRKLSSYKHLTTQFIEQNLKKNWSWTDLYENPSFDFVYFYEYYDDVAEDEDFWKSLSKNPNITVTFVEEHFDENWDWKFLSKNMKDITKVVTKHPTWPWNYVFLSMNKSLTAEFVEKHFDKEWNWDNLSHNENVVKTGLEKHIDEWPWTWKNVSQLAAIISPNLILQHKTKPWDWRQIAYYLNADVSFFEEHKDNFSFNALAGNRNLTVEFVEKNMDRFKNESHLTWKWLSERMIITKEYLQDHLYDRPWDPNALSQNIHLSPDIVLEHKDKFPWNWHGLSQNDAFDWKFILEHPNLPWEWGDDGLSGKNDILLE